MQHSGSSLELEAFLDDILAAPLSDANHALPIWTPLDGPQQDALNSPADVIGYGGAAGGGKSDLLLGAAMTAHERSIIFRRHYTDLTDLVERGDQILDGAASFVWGPKRRWDLPDGRLVELGAVEHEKDKYKYRGRPHDLIAIDEAADFSESIYRFLSGWLRTTRPGQRTRVILTFNPPTTPEGEWIVRYFAPWLDTQHANPAEPGELRWFVRINDADVEVESGDPYIVDGVTYTPKSRTFIQARVEDNPYLMATDYVAQLESLPEPLRSQLRYGDFTIGTSDDPWQCIPTAWVLEAQERGRTQQRPALRQRSVGVDVAYGGKDKTVISRLYGTWFDELLEYPGAETTNGAITADYVLRALDGPDTPVYIDSIGYGASAYDHLLSLHPNTTAVNNGSASRETDKSGKYGFVNLRAESYWRLREALDPSSGENIALPPSRQLRVDLCAPRYRLQGGKIALESKDDVKKRIGRSPDVGDAVVLAWHGANIPVVSLGSSIGTYA